MAPIANLIWRYRHKQISFKELLEQVPSLQWAIRREEANGSVWWDGDNSVEDIDILWHAELITDDEREEILDAIPNSNVH